VVTIIARVVMDMRVCKEVQNAVNIGHALLKYLKTLEELIMMKMKYHVS
jgi:hypothetical protein